MNRESRDETRRDVDLHVTEFFCSRRTKKQSTVSYEVNCRSSVDVGYQHAEASEWTVLQVCLQIA
jgi:F0F1-type ATP synthase beta subunit